MDAKFSPILAKSTGRFPWRPRIRDVLGITGLYLLTRLALIVVGMVAWGYQLPGSPTWRGTDHKTGIRYALVPDQPLLDLWTRWDSWEYDEISRTGYWYDFNHKPQPYGTVACFPLYPLSIRALSFFLGGQSIIAGLLVSSFSAVIGFVLLFQWVDWWADRGAAWLTVSAAISFPAGLFWSALYPQSLFFALSIVSMALMFDGRVAGACLLCGLATATRLEAVALIPALLLIRLSRDGWRVGLKDLWFLLTPLGLLAYMAYLQGRWGDPLLFLRVHRLFGRGWTNPLWTLVVPFQSPGGYKDLAVLGTYFVLGLLALGTMVRLRLPILVYGWLLFLIPLTSGVYVSIYRVHLVNFPIYLAIGLGLRGRLRWLGYLLVAIFLIVQAGMMFLWVIGYPLP